MMQETKANITKNADRPYAGASAPARREERREKLLAAALEIIGRSGFKAATVRTICREAGLTQRYYYEAFDDAEDMLAQVYAMQLARLEQVMREAAEQHTTAETRARATLTVILETVQADPRLARVLFYEVHGVSEHIDQIHAAGMRHLEQLLVDLALPLLQSEIPSHINLEIVARVAVGGIVQVVMTWMLADFDHEIDALVDSLAAVLVALVDHVLTA